MIERATGIILRTRLLTETSLIVHWLAPELGRVATVARGARRAASPFRGKLDLFYEADLGLGRSRRSDLHTLREVVLRETHPALRQDLTRLQQASYCAKLIEQTTETETPLPEIHATMRALLRHLDQHPAQPLVVFAFEMKLLQILGQSPSLEEANLTDGARQILRQTAEGDWAELAGVIPKKDQLREVQRFLHGFMIFHLGRIPEGRGAAIGGGSAGDFAGANK